MSFSRKGKKTLSTELRHKVYIQSLVTESDNAGGFVETWVDSEYSYWASVDPMRAAQKFEYASVNVEATHLIRLRGKTDIDDTQRIKFQDRSFEVLTVENARERDIVKWVICKERRE